MPRSERATRADELAAVRLADECRELGDDAVAWQGHLLAGLLARCGGAAAVVAPAPPPSGVPVWVAPQAGGHWPPAVYDRWVRRPDPAALADHPAVARFAARPEPALAVTRRELVDDRTWERSAFVSDTLRADGMDDGLVARTPAPAAGCSYVISVNRPPGDRPVRPRAARVAGEILRAVAPHLGRGLLLATQPNLSGLSPRRRAVLDCLLDGDSEKQVALRLRLRPTTVHDHVKRVYAHFGVSTRAELLAYFLRRYRR